MTKPFWGAVGLAACAFVLYAALAPQPLSHVPIRIDASSVQIERYAPGDVVPTGFAGSAPRGATRSFSPEGAEVYIPPREKDREYMRKRMDLPEPDRARFAKRDDKSKDDRKLQYRFRVDKGWELYRVPAEVRDVFLDTATAMAVAQTAGGQPAVAVSGRQGYEITSINPGSLFEQAGILPGDIIISVNDRPVQGAEDGRRLYAELKHETEFLVVVERDGEIINLYYELEKESK